MNLRPRGAMPGFWLSAVLTLVPLALVVVIPLAGLVTKTASLSPHELAAAVFTPRTIASYKVTFGAA